MPLRLAIVLSGAVALGSYEAGAVYEIMRAVDAGAPLAIDLVAGVSAGAFIGAAAVKHLVAGAGLPGLLAWQEVTLERLTRHYGRNSTSLLSSAAVGRLARRSLVDPPPRLTPPRLAQRVSLLISLTNLDGQADPAGGAPRYDEAVRFDFDLARPKGELAARPVWRRIALVARASAAIPVAFDPVHVPWLRRVQGAAVQETWASEAAIARNPWRQAAMRYCDGLVVENHPLDCLLPALPPVAVIDPERRIVFIEPHPPGAGLPDLPQRPLSLFGQAARAAALRGTWAAPWSALARLRAHNQRVVRLAEILADLAHDLRQDPVPSFTHVPPIDPAVEAFYRRLAGGEPEAPPALLPALLRLRHRYGLLEAGRQAMLKGAHSRLAAHLGISQPWLQVDHLAPEDPRRYLAGEEFLHFGGFFSPDLLAHDFQVGRRFGHAWLRRTLPDCELPEEPAEPEPQPGLTVPLFLANLRPLGRVFWRLLLASVRATRQFEPPGA